MLVLRARAPGHVSGRLKKEHGAIIFGFPHNEKARSNAGRGHPFLDTTLVPDYDKGSRR